MTNTNTKTYELVNEQGCHCEDTKATSIASARAKFALRWSGEYKIICGETGEEKKVKLA